MRYAAPASVDSSSLPVFEPGASDLVDRREDFKLGLDQEMTVLGDRKTAHASSGVTAESKITTILNATSMRPIASLSNEDRVIELFYLPSTKSRSLRRSVPDVSTPKAVAIANHGSATELDLYKYDAKGWATAPASFRRIVAVLIVVRTAGSASSASAN